MPFEVLFQPHPTPRQLSTAGSSDFSDFEINERSELSSFLED